MNNPLDAFLKISAAIAALLAGFAIFYHYVIYVPQVERKITNEHQRELSASTKKTASSSNVKSSVASNDNNGSPEDSGEISKNFNEKKQTLLRFQTEIVKARKIVEAIQDKNKKALQELPKIEKQLKKTKEEIKTADKNVYARQKALHDRLAKQTKLLNDLREKKEAYQEYLKELEFESKNITNWLQKNANMERKQWVQPVNDSVIALDYRAKKGAPVFAAYDGKVYYSGRWGEYGKVVILDHGGGIATVYSGFAKITDSKGKFVKAGQVIGYAGDRGIPYNEKGNPGPHIHFEIRKNGVPVNPLE